jgi:hypothetical protein
MIRKLPRTNRRDGAMHVAGHRLSKSAAKSTSAFRGRRLTVVEAGRSGASLLGPVVKKTAAWMKRCRVSTQRVDPIDCPEERSNLVSKAQNQSAIKLPLFHPLAEMFPLLEGKDFDDFVADIGKHELQNDIDTWQGMILEGRNRARACQQLGIEPRYHECRFQDEAGARAYVISQNMHRRHLTAGQKRDIIAALLKADPAKSNREHARTARLAITRWLPFAANRRQLGRLPS